jgi:integral membrane sensor domain MASE1
MHAFVHHPGVVLDCPTDTDHDPLTSRMTTFLGSRGPALAVFGAVSLALVELARLADDPSVLGSFPAVWPLAGLVTAALLLRPRREWPAFLVIACGAMVLSSVALHGGRPLPTVVAAVMFGLQSAVTAWAVRRYTAEEPFSLDRLPHATALVAAGVLVPLIFGLLAAVILFPRDAALIVPVWRTWWLAETIGVLVTAPLALAVMTLGRDAVSALRPARAVEVAIGLAAGIVVTEGVLGGRFPPVMQVPAYILPLLLWPVFRFGPAAGSVATFIVGFLALWHASRGEGPLALYTNADDIVLRSQGGVAIAGASVLLLASVVAERKRVAHERDLLLADLEHALAEIKTLEGFIPICAWCHKVRDDAGFWQQLERYLDEKTGATFSHSICPTCTEREQLGIRNAELRMREHTHS